MMDYYDHNEHWMHHPQMQDDIDPDDAMKSGCFVLTFYAVALIGVIVIMLLLSSCTTTKVVTVEKVKHDTTYVSKHSRDSIYIHDSTFIKEKGDSVLIEKWHTAWRDRWHHDTIVRIKVDSIPYPVEVVKEVERPLTKTERGLILLGVLSIMFITIFIALKVKRYLPH